MESTSHFDRVPVELLGIISEYLNYEDVIILEKLTGYSILNRLLHINSEIKYTFQTAPQIHLGILDTRLHYVSDSVLIQVTQPQDFNLLMKFKNLQSANFVLPHNKYESMTEFIKYLETFFDFFFGRPYGGNYKDLVFRILFSSDYNKHLGLVIYKGLINLVNSYNYVGYDVMKDDTRQHDFLINIINEKHKKYQRELLLMYTINSRDNDDNMEDVIRGKDYNYDVYLEKGIVPIFSFSCDNRSLKTQVVNGYADYIEDIRNGYFDNKYLKLQERVLTFEEEDYLIVNFRCNINETIGLSDWSKKYPYLLGKPVGLFLDEIENALTNGLNFELLTDIDKALDKYKVIYKHDSFMKENIENGMSYIDKFLLLMTYDQHINDFEYMYSKVLDNIKSEIVPNIYTFNYDFESDKGSYKTIYKYDTGTCRYTDNHRNYGFVIIDLHEIILLGSDESKIQELLHSHFDKLHEENKKKNDILNYEYSLWYDTGSDSDS